MLLRSLVSTLMLANDGRFCLRSVSHYMYFTKGADLNLSTGNW